MQNENKYASVSENVLMHKLIKKNGQVFFCNCSFILHVNACLHYIYRASKDRLFINSQYSCSPLQKSY